ncbi:Chloride channel protein, putative [Pediculus humanus corporis]|uniref:Chloride channel protein n=1 Tax=Pediculus humanus subsp. corporis TaxID=121224 RepID=E0VT99_PEDHC|nr:Chloride channel protein, putative [Pediculus humanus corporis]EEB16605.1 Chloride channel protein, putative [Pediculus humanus corporis]
MAMPRKSLFFLNCTESPEREPLLRDRHHNLRYNGLSQSINNSEDSCQTEYECVDATASPLSLNQEWPPRKQKRITETVKPGQLNIISGKFESLDFDICENHLLIQELRSKGFKFIIKKDISRWFIFCFIGIFTAIIAAFIDIAVNELTAFKFKNIKKYIDTCISKQCLYQPYLIWIAFNVLFVLIGSIIVTYIEPVAAGSGIPDIKCYLNGVLIPRLVRIKTLVVKVLGVILSVVGGLSVGKEGPMIHSGSIVGAGISQGKSTTFSKDFGVFGFFREDCEKRDFVSAGAAAGVAAAFGAPIGGVLFAVEEGISFWHQSLIGRILFCSLISTFTLNIILSAYHGHLGDLSYSGLLDFGKFDTLHYELGELLIYVLMGVLGGLLGALSNHLNYKLTVFRIRYLTFNWMKVIEAAIVASFTCTIAFLMIYLVNDCKPLGQNPVDYPLQMYCGDGEYNALAALWFQTPEACVRSLFHDDSLSIKPLSIFLFALVYFFVSCWTYGLSISSGLFVPSLLTGAAWGRLCGIGLNYLTNNEMWADPAKYAVIGAAAQLGGIVRMPLSLSVILMEGTGNIVLGFPLIITLIVAKWTGDYFNEGIYDIHTRLKGVPILPWEPPPLAITIYATEIMSYPVIAFSVVEKVSNIINILKTKSHNGFPVVNKDEESDNGRIKSNGRYRGLILRSQLIVLLNNKVFNENNDNVNFLEKINLKIFRNAYPRYMGLDKLKFSEKEMNYHIDLRPYMNPSSYTVLHSASLPKVFRLFRTLGLRHLPVVSDRNKVIGMVTRKDLARYHVWNHRGKMWLEELKISKNCTKDCLLNY